MASLPPPGSHQEALLTRMGTLQGQLRYKDRHTPKYQRLSAAIRELSTAYCALVDAQRGTAKVSATR